MIAAVTSGDQRLIPHPSVLGALMNGGDIMTQKRFLTGLVIGASFVALAAMPVGAQTFSSGSTGADGPFNPSCTPTPCTVTVTLPESGVFNFTTVDIASGVRVTFTKNAANTPVTILASGDMTIAGSFNVNGQNAGKFSPGPGGPGGFDGGMGGSSTASLDGTAGLGPGGGGGGDTTDLTGGNGSFGRAGEGAKAGPVYGVPTLIPLIGGSGGGGGGAKPTQAGGGGGGGGGAILIASSGVITLTGTIRASGGDGRFVFDQTGGSASGGAVRLIANRIEGNGQIQASGGSTSRGRGGAGRVRLEAFEIAFTGVITTTPSPGLPGPVTAPTRSPALRITAVAGVNPPANAQGSFLTTPDITLSLTVTNPVTVELAASNIPLGTNVEVTVTPEGGAQTTVLSTALSGTEASSTASATVTLPNGISIISATATFATTVASLGSPTMIGGEEVKWVKVAATHGGNSSVTYITASGREVKVR